jgi:hypothetical protein
MEHLRSFLVELYRGSKERYVHARYALVVFDLVIIVYFVVTTFLPPYSWIAIVDLLIGTVLLVELLARALIERDRINFLLQPWTILDIVVIASLLIPAMTGSFVFLRVLRALRLMRSYFVVRELRRHSKFFARNEEIIFSALNLLVFVFIVSAIDHHRLWRHHLDRYSGAVVVGIDHGRRCHAVSAPGTNHRASEQGTARMPGLRAIAPRSGCGLLQALRAFAAYRHRGSLR